MYCYFLAEEPVSAEQTLVEPEQEPEAKEAEAESDVNRQQQQLQPQTVQDDPEDGSSVDVEVPPGRSDDSPAVQDAPVSADDVTVELQTPKTESGVRVRLIR